MANLRIMRSAFTLVELLVVIAVIALLMSILLPSLSGARRVARTVACGANLRQIDVAMRTYGEEYNDAILGNAQTSGAFLTASGPSGHPYNNNNCPNICQIWDWAAPVALENGLPMNIKGDSLSRAARFDYLCRFKGFLCPENDILSGPFGGSIQSLNSSGSPILFTPMVAYNTALMFQYVYPRPSTAPAGNASINLVALGQSYINTASYKPKLGLVGNQSCKVFIADGGRWCNSDTAPPDFELDFDGSGTSPGGCFSDYGPWSMYTRAYGHNNLGDVPSTKPITYSMRHGSRQPQASLGSYRFNAAFFDGHVETLDGNRGLNPNLWLPSGAVLPSSECTKDAINQFFGGASSLTIANN